MTDYRIELQAFVDAAASFTEPALGHHKAWAEAVTRARVALSMPESSASTVCPITPPPELIEKWHSSSPLDRSLTVATQAARWGADQELEACCEWLKTKEWIHPEFSDELRDLRRPKPPSLKTQALNELRVIRKTFEHQGLGSKTPALDAALERLGELEQLDD